MSPEFRLRPLLSDNPAEHGFHDGGRVSPEFRLRPLLSAPRPQRLEAAYAGVAGVQAPAFVERTKDATILIPAASSVAGVQAPAFVERGGFLRQGHPNPAGVAGVQAPAFVERTRPWCLSRRSRTVSPEFRLRPLLSDPITCRCITGSVHVSPEFRLRPLLSESELDCRTLDRRACRRSSGSGLC